MEERTGTSDGRARAWPESHGLGLAFPGLGFMKSQARPEPQKLAWPGPGSGLSHGLCGKINNKVIVLLKVIECTPSSPVRYLK